MDITEFFKSILSRISNYELLNNLIPGAAYIALMDKITNFHILSGNLISDVAICYVVGIVIGRIGSICIEDGIIRFKGKEWLGRAPYQKYVQAEKQDTDGQLRKISMINNMYRSLAAVFACLSVTMLLYGLLLLVRNNWWAQVVTLIIIGVIFSSIFVLMCLAFKKQTTYVIGRMNILNNETPKLGKKDGRS